MIFGLEIFKDRVIDFRGFLMSQNRGMAPFCNPPPLQAGSNFFPAQTLSFYFFLCGGFVSQVFGLLWFCGRLQQESSVPGNLLVLAVYSIREKRKRNLSPMQERNDSREIQRPWKIFLSRSIEQKGNERENPLRYSASAEYPREFQRPWKSSSACGIYQNGKRKDFPLYHRMDSFQKNQRPWKSFRSGSIRQRGKRKRSHRFCPLFF